MNSEVFYDENAKVVYNAQEDPDRPGTPLMDPLTQMRLAQEGWRVLSVSGEQLEFLESIY